MRVYNSKTKKSIENQRFFRAGVTSVSIFSLKGQSSRSRDVKNLAKMTHIRRQCLQASPATPGTALGNVKVDFRLTLINEQKCCLIARRGAA